jgi:predicted XRE-type DNA-binding protein
MQGLKNTADEFWMRVKKTDSCWLWTSDRSPDGYGKFRFQGKTWRSHRLSYVLMKGPINDGLLVCHTCDTPLCVRPDHLFLGTVLDNNRDCAAKGHRKGIRNNAKITQAIADEIRALYASGKFLQREIGQRFGLSQGQVSSILSRYKGAWT